ncbi:ribose ABC transporter substrate-binding protein RbsB [Halalkalibacillus sediminis]|uniref:Ribose import binding protein RbsB n=1 Tax=Halalkalibacillus sediminis TaxID=2018042 RepID=A0A2I0QV08_9BACI|nr:ribose ABC transporter substrate-binding protein RbsB [Halalkalibacillus sediminis]PKR77930.1 ribose ABC transporter substrate-binding protein RbsB [Halalkalibacillus sediminis]
MAKSLKMLFTLLVLSVLVVACSTESPASDNGEESEGEDSGETTVGLSVSTQGNPFFVTLVDGAKAKAEELGVELTVVDAQNDAATQSNDIEDLIQQGVDVLVVNPVDSSAISSTIESANDADIPVITVDRSAEGGEVVTHIASNNVSGGEMAGDYIVEQLGGEGKVVELEGIPGSSAANERGEGFHNVVDEEDGIEVVAQQPADFDRSEGLSVMENIIQGNPDIQAVFAHNDEMALGAVQALESAGMEDVMVVGFDATDDAVAAVEEGTMAATIAQQPTIIGEEGIQAAYDVTQGEEPKESISVELELVNE